MTRMRAPGVLFAAGALVLLAGCGAADESAGGSAGTPPPATTEPAPEPSGGGTESVPKPADEPGMRVPEELRFTAKTVDGKDFAGKSLAGEAAVLWFWAPWCPNCQAEAPGIARAAKETAGTVTFVGVAGQDQVPAMRDFVQRYGLGHVTHLADTDGSLWKRFGVTYQPAYAFVTPDGTVEVETNQLSEEDLLSRARALADDTR